MRTEHDMLGTRSLSDDTLYGLQTLRAKKILLLPIILQIFP